MKRKKKKKYVDEETTYWLSYSDMMAALLLTFVLIISFTMLQSKKQYEAKEAELVEQEIELDKMKQENEDQKKLLEDQQKKAEEAEKVANEQQELLQEQQDKIDKLVGVRTEIVQNLKTAFEDTDLEVNVDPQTGAITFNSEILFEFKEDSLSQEGKEFLKEFIPKYLDTLLNDNYKAYIAEIIIEGHTDSVGDYLTNLALSQERALEVAKYILADNSEVDIIDLDYLRKIVTANGRSYNDLIYKEGTDEEDADASRRVEFKFRLTEDEMISEMDRIFSESKN